MRLPRLVVHELQPRRAIALRQKLGPVVDIRVLHAVHGLACTDAADVICIAYALAALAGRGKLPSVLPGEGPAAIARRVAYGVIGDCSAVLNQVILCGLRFKLHSAILRKKLQEL